jgi:Peptidase A4 family
VYALPAPPKGFNPATASPAELQAFGLPPRPSQQENPKGYASWLNAVSIPNRITPVLEQMDIYSRPMQEAPAGGASESQAKAHAMAGPSAPAASTLIGSLNWAGWSVYDGSAPFKLEAVVASYVVPVARNPFGNCPSTPQYDVWSVSWVGIDGLGNSTLVQNGTLATSYNDCAASYTYYYPWFEYLPNPITAVVNAPVEGGDYVWIQTWAASSTEACAYWSNQSQQWAGGLCYTKPSGGINIQGASVEWITERPYTGEGTHGYARLTNYVTVPFWESYAYNYQSSSPTYYYAGYNPTGTLYQVYGVDDSNNLNSYPYLAGIDSIFFYDYGSAYCVSGSCVPRY